MASRSCLEMRPTLASMAECALLPAMSKGASRWSNDTDSLNFSINSAGPAVKRPPQVAWDFFAIKRTESRRALLTLRNAKDSPDQLTVLKNRFTSARASLIAKGFCKYPLAPARKISVFKFASK